MQCLKCGAEMRVVALEYTQNGATQSFGCPNKNCPCGVQFGANNTSEKEVKPNE